MKVSTLECFLSMIKVLDKVRVSVCHLTRAHVTDPTLSTLQISLTQKLVPLLSKVKTKEPEGKSLRSTCLPMRTLTLLGLLFSLGLPSSQSW